MKTIDEIKHDLEAKEERVQYWERFGKVPSMNELHSQSEFFGGGH